jgi:undecaprenyl-diphosphatase
MIAEPARRTIAVAAGMFLVLALAAAFVGILPGDVTVRDAVLAAASPPVIAVLRIVNLAGNWRVLLPGTLLLFALFPHARARWWVWLGLMIVAPLAEGTLKLVIARTRPEATSLGFPSGHATAAAAFFGAVIYLAAAWPAASRRWARALAVVAIVLVGLARISLRAHWPSDVVAGVALGFALASVALLMSEPTAAPKPRRSTPPEARADASSADV